MARGPQEVMHQWRLRQVQRRQAQRFWDQLVRQRRLKHGVFVQLHATVVAGEAAILPAHGRNWRSRFLDEPYDGSRVHRQRKELVRLQFIAMSMRSQRWMRSQQRTLVERARVVNALPRRALAVAFQSTGSTAD